jgi:SAM-dependent methyltransferase
MTAPTMSPDFDAIKARQRATWSSGDYAMIGATLQITGESLCEAVDLNAGERVLDVAAGNGNATLAAARRGCDVVACDYVPALLQRLLARAESDGLTVETREGDAEALPFDDATFDVVLSTFGVMFTPDQERSASELLRVCRPGGRIGLANWTPDGFIGQVLKTVGRYVPPPTAHSPLEWGTKSRLDELFGPGVQSLEIQRQNFMFRYRSPQDWVDTFRTYYGPVHKAFGALDEAGKQSLERDLVALVERFNTGTSDSVRVPGEYLEVVAVTAE